MRLSGLLGTPLVVSPSPFSGQPWKEINHLRNNKKSIVAKKFPTQCTTIQMKPPTTEAMKTVLESSTSPVTAHQPS